VAGDATGPPRAAAGAAKHSRFLAAIAPVDQVALRELSTLFLAEKEFHGVDGLVVNDDMAVAIAAQACLPVLHLGLDWYSGFKGIVVHADAVVARREMMDETGVVHEFDEELSGEAMDGGPVMLSWQDVESSGESAEWGYNVVIHEFAHVLDMRDGVADGVPPLESHAARQAWQRVLSDEFDALGAAIDAGRETLIDTYGADSPGEFFAVAAETFFTMPTDMRSEHPALYDLLAGFFRQDPAQREGA
jgi:MtfA peptidase